MHKSTKEKLDDMLEDISSGNWPEDLTVRELLEECRENIDTLDYIINSQLDQIYRLEKEVEDGREW